MKQCPACNRTYTDDDLLLCLEDGTQLQSVGFGTSGDAPTTIDANYDPNKTLAFSPTRETSPPPTNVYAPTPPASQPPAQQHQWSPSPTPSYTPAPSMQ